MRAVIGSADVLERAKLFSTSAEECVAFFVAEPVGEDLRLVDVRPMRPGDFAGRSDAHVQLADHVRPELIAWAWEQGLSLVEAHTHPGGDRACLSPTDVIGLSEWVPHVRWRLRGSPYAALVFAETTIDGVGWTGGSNAPQGLAALEIDGQPPRLMTGLSLPYMQERMNSHG
jgi:hypothetical protein